MLRQLSPDLLHDVSLQKKKEGWEQMIMYQSTRWNKHDSEELSHKRINTDTTSIRCVAYVFICDSGSYYAIHLGAYTFTK